MKYIYYIKCTWNYRKISRLWHLNQFWCANFKQRLRQHHNPFSPQKHCGTPWTGLQAREFSARSHQQFVVGEWPGEWLWRHRFGYPPSSEGGQSLQQCEVTKVFGEYLAKHHVYLLMFVFCLWSFHPFPSLQDCIPENSYLLMLCLVPLVYLAHHTWCGHSNPSNPALKLVPLPPVFWWTQCHTPYTPYSSWFSRGGFVVGPSAKLT